MESHPRESSSAGGVNKVPLHAPKGTAIETGMLYVRTSNSIASSTSRGQHRRANIKIPGATFLNEVDAERAANRLRERHGHQFGEKGHEPTARRGLQ